MKTLSVLIFFIILISGCKKAETDDYKIASKGKQVEFHNLTGCRVQVLIEHWGTGTEIYPTNTAIMEAFRGSDGQNVLGRRFTVWALVDNKWDWTGWDFVQCHNDLSIETLHNDTIQINNP